MTADDRDERDENGGAWQPSTCTTATSRRKTTGCPSGGNYTLYGAIVFAAVYWYGEHQFKAWEPRDVAFQQEMVAVAWSEAKKAERARSGRTRRDARDVEDAGDARGRQADLRDDLRALPPRRRRAGTSART